MSRLRIDLTEWRGILFALLATRAGLAAVGIVAWATMSRGGSFLDMVPEAPWLSMWAQWDAEHYLVIAVEGYSYLPGHFSNTAFFPLFPWVVHVVTALFGPVEIAGAALVGLVVANLSLFVALLYLAALVQRDLGPSVARRAVLYLLVFPTTFFLSAMYAESLFLAGAVASLYHARRGEWYRAGAAGFVAALARPFGILLVVPIAIEMLRQRTTLSRALRALPAIALVPAGTATFFAFLWYRFGDPTLYLKANAVWGREFSPPWEPLLGYWFEDVVVFGWYFSIVDLSFVVGMTLLAAAAWGRLPDSYTALAAAAVLFTLSTSVWISTPRHAVAIFPLVVMLAVFGERRDFHRPWLLLSIVLAVGFALRYFSGNWIA